MNATNEQASTALTRARATLILDQPFFGTLALRLHLSEDSTIPTAAIDGRTLFYNPQFILAQTTRVRQSVVAHEVAHCFLDHLGREGSRNHDKWNDAADYCANLLLYDAGFDIPAGWLMDAQYRGMSAEHIYALLPDDPAAGSRPGPGQPGGSMDDIRPAATPANARASAAEHAELARDWRIATLQAAAAAQGAGRLPGCLETLVDVALHPQLDWQTVLRRFVTERADDDYSWTRPNRRMIVHGLYLPSLYSEALGAIDVAVDSSGSMMDAATLAAVATELDAIIAHARPRRVRIIYCDSIVQKVQVVERGEPFAFHAVGGGGTRFQPVFDWVEASGEAPAALIYLTDLIGPTSFAAPSYPVLWCTTTTRRGPWGQTLRIAL